MQDALKRLQELQRQLEALRRTTEDVIAESQRLIQDIHLSPPTPIKQAPVSGVKKARRSRKRR